MFSRERTIIARSPILLLEYARTLGLDDADLMRDAGLVAENLFDPDSRVPVAKVRGLWRAVMERVDDPVLGLNIGRSVDIRRMGLVGYVLYYSADLGSALQQLSRYGRIVSEAVQFRLHHTNGKSVFRCDAHPFMITLRHPIEGTLALLLTTARELAGDDIEPLQVCLPSPRPSSVAEYRSVFGRHVKFDCPYAELTFARRHMRLATKDPDLTLAGYLTELADEKLRDLGQRYPNLVDRVRRCLWSMLPGAKPELSSVAAQLGMSPRTLQRRLRDTGTSFSAVLEELRREMSEELRAHQGFAAADVAFLLGYSESGAYQRAARRWRGSNDSAQGLT